MNAHSLMRWWGLAAAAMALNATVALADSGDASPLSPDDAVTLALTAHPDLRTAEAARNTASASRSAASVLLYNPSAEAWSSSDGSRAELSLSQPLSLSGEGRHARRAARHSLESAEASLARRRREIGAAVRLAYIEAVVAVGVVGVAREGSELSARLNYAMTRKHEEGEASTLELRLTHLSQSQAATRLLEAHRDEVHALRRLAGWVLTPVDAASIDTDPLSAVPTATLQDNGGRADILSAEAALQAAREELKRARSAALPAVALGVGVDVEGGTSHIGPSLGLTLPLMDRNQVESARAQGEVRVAESRLAALVAIAETEQRTSAQRLEAAEAVAASLDFTGLEEARAALESIESGLLAGELDLATAVLLQGQALDGEAAAVTLRGLIAEARVDRMLALDDDALLGGRSPRTAQGDRR